MSNPHKTPKATYENDIGLKLVRIVRLKRQLIDIRLDATDLSRTQWQALLWIHRIENCTQKDLLKHLDIDAGHLARVLEQLEQRKYIIRKPLPTDRRCLSIQATAHSKRHVIPKILRALEEEKDILLSGLNQQDRTQLLQLLCELEKNLETQLSTPTG
jgi:DNA-binding MarR family transcriptional regulator